jgi:hypothetical protein
MTVTLSVAVTDKTATGRWTPQRRERPKIAEPIVRNSNSNSNTGSSGNRRKGDSMTVPTSSPTEDEEDEDEEEDESPQETIVSSRRRCGITSHHTDQDCAITATAAASTTIPLVRSQQHVDDDRKEETTRSMTQPRPQHHSSSSHIRWSTVEIREYAIILGDNPSVIRGVPLTMDWTPLSSISLELEDYERLKPHPPRRPEQMLRNASQREELLLNIVVYHDHPPPLEEKAEDQEGCEVGVGGDYLYTPSMLRHAHRMISTLRHQRRQTNQMRRWDAIHEQWEKVTRTLQRTMGIRPSKQWERAFLQQHGCSSGRSTTVKGVMRSSLMTTTTIATSTSTTTMGTS